MSREAGIRWPRTLSPLIAALAAPGLALALSGAEVFLPGRLLEEMYPGESRLRVRHGVAGAPSQVRTWDKFEAPTDAGDNFTRRVRGFFLPQASGNYVFYVSADDDADLFLGTDESPASRRLIAQETAWSSSLQWTSSDGGSSVQQKRSDQFSPDGGVTFPFASGIFLQQGTRYYLEGVHHEGTGGDNFAVTYKLVGAPDPAAGFPSFLTGGVIGVAVRPPSVLAISQQPQSQAVYAGTLATFAIVVNTDAELPLAYQWRRNGATLPGATRPTLTFPASSSDNGAKYDCFVSIPDMPVDAGFATTVVSAEATLTVRSDPVLVTGKLKEQVFPAATLSELAAGATGPPASIREHSSFEAPVNVGENFGRRISGLFSPPVTGSYVFFVSSDDGSELYLSTDDDPANKQLIAQETAWSGPREWTVSGGGSVVTQKRSDQFSPDGGVSRPFAAGIPLEQGRRYYLEGLQREGAGGDNFSATFIVAGAGDPANGSPTAMVGERIAYQTAPVTGFMITGQPQSRSVKQQQTVSFSVTVETDGELSPSFQWRRNGSDIPGANGATYTRTASLGDDGVKFSCVVSSPQWPESLTSNEAVLTVQPAEFIAGYLLHELWGPDDTHVSRLGVEAGSAGEPLTSVHAPFFASTEGGLNYVRRMSGVFVAPETGNYVFFLSADDDADLFLSTDENPADLRLIAQETAWSAANEWTSSSGGSNLALKRSDQWTDGNGGQPFAGGIPLEQGKRYFLQGIHHQGVGGGHFSVTFKRMGQPDPANGSPTQLTVDQFGWLAPSRATELVGYPGFAAANGLVLGGSAVLMDSAVRLTQSLPGQNGAMHQAAMVSLKGGFETRFTFRLSQPGGGVDAEGQRGGDGFAFIIHKQDPFGFNPYVGYIPYSLQDCLAIEFDTWKNSNLADPNGNHVSLQFVGANPDFMSEFHQNHSRGVGFPAFDLTDGAVHTARIRYEGEELSVYLDDLSNPVFTTGINLTDIGGRSVLNANQLAAVGLVAGTGVAFQQHEILSWTMEAASVPVITRQPQPVHGKLYGKARFSVEASGFGPFTYQWRRDGQILPGEVLSTLELVNLDYFVQGAYTVEVRNAVGAVISASASLSVTEVIEGADAYDDATPFSLDYPGGFFVSGDFSGASWEEGDPTASSGRSLWWQVTPSFTQRVLFDTGGSTFTSAVGIYTRDGSGSFHYYDSSNIRNNPETFNGGALCCGAFLSKELQSGVTYFIVVHDEDAFTSGGRYQLEVQNTENLNPHFSVFQDGLGFLDSRATITNGTSLLIRGMSSGRLMASGDYRLFDNGKLLFHRNLQDASPRNGVRQDFLWATPPLGEHTLTLRVDADGKVGISSDFRVTVVPREIGFIGDFANVESQRLPSGEVIVTNRIVQAQNSSGQSTGPLRVRAVLGSTPYGRGFLPQEPDPESIVSEFAPVFFDPLAASGTLNVFIDALTCPTDPNFGDSLQPGLQFQLFLILEEQLGDHWVLLDRAKLVSSTPKVLFPPNFGQVGKDSQENSEIVVLLTGLQVDGPTAINEATSTALQATARFSDGINSVVTPLWSVNQPFTIDAIGQLSAPALSISSNALVTATYSRGTRTFTVPKTIVVADVPAPPLISSGPVSRTNVVGTSAEFSVTATGDAPLGYQWQHAGTNLVGRTAATLLLDSVTANDAGSYQVIVSNPVDSVTSAPAELTVHMPPGISTQPASRTNVTGTSASFTVVASGLPTPAYQWQHAGTNLPGQTSSTLALPNVTTNDAGNYQVIVSNAAGSVTSAPAALTVRVIPSITGQPASRTNVAGTSATFTVTATGLPAPAYQWRHAGTNLPGQTSATLTLANLTTNDAGSYQVIVANAVGSMTSDPAVLTVHVGPSILAQPVGRTNLVGTSASFTVVASGLPTPTYQWQHAGTNLSGQTSATLVLPDVTTNDAGNYQVVVSNAAGSLPSDSAALTVHVPPAISGQPASRTNVAGTSATFAVMASGVPAPTYQWRHAGTNLPGQTSATLALANVTANDAGNYQVVVANTAGGVTSEPAVLTVYLPPAITAQPTGRTNLTGTSASFAVLATGHPNPSYQWQHAGTNLMGQTSATLTFSNVTTNDAGSYQVIVSNAAGSVTSNPATLTVHVPPAISGQPASRTNVAGTSATFAVVASGLPAPTYQWQHAGTNLAGQNSVTLTLNNVTTNDTGSYRVMVSNAAATVTSEPALLTVHVPPSITSHPASRTNVIATSASFTVMATGLPEPTYQWQHAGTNLMGQTAATLMLASVTTNDAGTYRVVVSNAAGFSTSDPAVLTVTPLLATLNLDYEFLTDGRFRIRLTGQPGVTYTILRSTNLIDWLAVFTDAPASGSLEYTMRVSPDQVGEYYRALGP